MSSLSDLVTLLKREAKVESSEGFDDDLDLTPDVEEAITRHNPYYTAASLPDAEIPLVILLAWSKICLRRANKFAKEPDSKGAQGFGVDRSTPYTKNISLAKMLEDRYKAMADNLGLGNSATSIVTGRLFKREELTAQITPNYINNLPVIKFTLPTDDGGSAVILEWDTRNFEEFNEYILFAKEGEAVYQKWNIDSAIIVPFINSSATRVADIRDRDQRAIKVTGLDRSVTNHFILVSSDRGGKYGYSNEVVVPVFP